VRSHDWHKADPPRPSASRLLFGGKGAMGKIIFRSVAAIAMALIVASAPGLGQAEGRPPLAPEYAEMIAKRAKERAKIDNCQKQATEQKMLPRDRAQFVISCSDK
jgi:hypothetical protein